MKILKPLQKVIERITESSVDTLRNSIDTGKSKLISVGKDGKVIKEKNRGLLSKIFKRKEERTYYCVTTDVKSDLVEARCFIEDQMEDRVLQIVISYQVLCHSGNEDVVIEALHKNNSSPGQRLNRLINDWVSDYENNLRENKDSLICSFDQKHIELRNTIKNYIQDEIGLDSEVKIQPVGSPLGEMVVMDSEYFSVRFQDFDYNVNLKFKCELKIDLDKRVAAYTTKISENRLSDIVKKTIIARVKEINLSDFLSLISSEKPFSDSINNKISNYGRKISKIKIIPEKDMKMLIDRGFEDDGYKHRVRNKINSQEISLNLIYEAKPIRRKEDQIIKAIFNGEPVQNFNRFLSGQIDAFRKSTEKDLINDFGELKDDIRRYLIDKSREIIGVDVDLDIKVGGEGDIGNKKIESQNFYALVKDYQSNHIEFSYSIELGIRESHKMIAISQNWVASEVENKITEKIKQILIEGGEGGDKENDENTMITIGTLYSNPETVNNEIKRLLGKTAEGYGRKIDFFKLKRLSDIKVKEQENYDITVDCRIKDYPRMIQVENRLIIKLTDLSLFLTKNIQESEIENWLQTTFDKIVQEVLFEKTYVQILTKIDKIEKKIKKKINKAVSAIGYSINQHLVVPDLQHWKLKTEGFSIEEGNLELPTKDPMLKVKVKLIIKGEVEELSKLSRYLNINPDADIKQKIRDVATAVIEEIMYDVTPERFYRQFENSSPDGKKPLRRTLEDAIRQRLLNQENDKTFGLNSNSLRIVINPAQTDLIDRFQMLQRERYVVIVNAMSFVDIDDATLVKFKVPFTIRQINENGWYTFLLKTAQKLKQQVDNIEEVVKDALTRKLQTLENELLQYNDYSTLNEIQVRLVDSIKVDVANECGVDIDLGQFQRVFSEEEYAALNASKGRRKAIRDSGSRVINNTLKSREEQIEVLLEERNRLAKIGDEDEELEKIEKKLKKLSPKLDSVELPTKKSKERKPKNERTKLSDFSAMNQSKIEEPKTESKEPQSKEDAVHTNIEDVDFSEVAD